MSKEQFENYLSENNFDQQLSDMVTTLKNQRIVLYGIGKFFQYLNERFDLSELNIVALADHKFQDRDLGSYAYPAISPSKINDFNPDLILVSTFQHFDSVKKKTYSSG